MEDDGSRRHRGELFAALAAMGFGSAYVATSFALLAFEPVPAAAWRSFLAAIAVGIIVVVRGRRGGSTGSDGNAPPAESVAPRRRASHPRRRASHPRRPPSLHCRRPRRRRSRTP